MSQSLKLRLTATAAALAALPLFAGNAVAATHTLDGKTLTIDELWAISAPGEKVKISADGWKRLKASYRAPIDAATDGRDIYGLTVNYGDLKDSVWPVLVLR